MREATFCVRVSKHGLHPMREATFCVRVSKHGLHPMREATFCVRVSKHGLKSCERFWAIRIETAHTHIVILLRFWLIAQPYVHPKSIVSKSKIFNSKQNVSGYSVLSFEAEKLRARAGDMHQLHWSRCCTAVDLQWSLHTRLNQSDPRSYITDNRPHTGYAGRLLSRSAWTNG